MKKWIIETHTHTGIFSNGTYSLPKRRKLLWQSWLGFIIINWISIKIWKKLWKFFIWISHHHHWMNELGTKTLIKNVNHNHHYDDYYEPKLSFFALTNISWCIFHFCFVLISEYLNGWMVHMEYIFFHE